ncbi:MAG: SDR family NAD(P)-dependent oxidoreductase [Candidatus Hodarchaeota archaeon]
MSSLPVIDLFKLTGKVALVTGGAKGLGTAINEGLLEAGIKTLIFCGRGHHGSLSAEQDRLSQKFDATIFSIKCDVSDERSVKEMIQQIKQNNIEKVDILINNAGLTWNAPTIDQTFATWHRVIDVNLTGLFLVTREIANDFMIPQIGGSIINISSILAFQGIEVGAQIGYTASKSGILGLTRQLAAEWSIYKIRVNAILPSFIEGNTMAKVFTNENSPVRDSILDTIPIRRFAHFNDIKAAICFLASEASSYITGQSLVLDGGMSIK